uniref:Uncharacterized protein n=1 Tax=Candidatus Kentrum sp. FM TaxID=2126340 RepID=A0A450S2C7_9GAMM|nr:MAG: hypothetical protein BECKFM1743A_GA0114220_1002918 [Candidatus Kentron sp. FM]VFJ45982.1 MAG: hypothetical protein BECKFM1743C_GA0114222_1003218 [Candidatus Kentron sp. FM]VFK07434.1 MAG: hypothetical protein BECKFM1743B_GA0114221_1004018 [Candidatus Kentron sp. FM]
MTDGSHVLVWENVKWDSKEEGRPHEVYGLALPESALRIGKTKILGNRCVCRSLPPISLGAKR